MKKVVGTLKFTVLITNRRRCRKFICFSPSLPPYILLFFFLFFFFLFCLLAISYLLLACWLGQQFCISLFVCICLHPDALSSVVLISDLLYQSAACVFPDGSRVSELLIVSLAFDLFVVGTVIFARCSYGFDCSRPLVCCRQ